MKSILSKQILRLACIAFCILPLFVAACDGGSDDSDDGNLDADDDTNLPSDDDTFDDDDDFTDDDDSDSDDDDDDNDDDETLCDGACADMLYTECTCDPDDPCGWVGDDYCDYYECQGNFGFSFDDRSADCGDDDDDDDVVDDDDDTTDDDDDTTDDDDSTDDDDDDDSTVKDAWTFIVYMAADNDLIDFAIDDLSEMVQVGSTADVNIIVIYDGTTNNDSRIYKVESTGLVVLANPGELNMGSANTVTSTVGAVIDAYPADRYGLVFWNHGSGWREKDHKVYKAVCEDYSASGDMLDNNELNSALAWINNNTDATSIDLLGFDACLMQMTEVAYYVRDNATVMVGSEETEDGDGWEYQNFLDDLIASPSMTPSTLGTKIAQAFVAKPDSTLSVLDLSKIGTLATAVHQIGQSLINVGGVNNNDVVNALYSTLYFEDWDFIDLYDFMDNLVTANINSTINTRANAVKSAVNNAVIYHGHGYSSYSAEHGISIYFSDPYYSYYDTDYDSTAFALATCWEDVMD